MHLARLPYDPRSVAEFYEQGLEVLGALCDRTWHDRMEVVAEGRAARLWGAGDGLHSGDLHFVQTEASAARDPAREVFPGCPLTFRLAEALRPSPLALERFLLRGEDPGSPPAMAVVEKLWLAQFPEMRRWRFASPFKRTFHFSLLALARCEIQAMDQHWSLHRVTVSLPDGALDEPLAGQFDYGPQNGTSDTVSWPEPDAVRWRELLERVILEDLQHELAGIRARQQESLARELERVDHYFDTYSRELASRASRSKSENVTVKTADRLSAAKAEHARRRTDQVARHEIRVHPHLDALLLIAEPAWSAGLEIEHQHRRQTVEARFIPRARRWVVLGGIE